MKLPRDLAGHEVTRLLARHYGYRVTRSRGSHMTATLTVGSKQHSVTVPGIEKCGSEHWTPSSPTWPSSLICPGRKYARRCSGESMHRLTLALILALVVQVPSAQSPVQLIVTVTDEDGAPVAGLTREDFTVSAGGVELDVVDVTPAPPAVQIVAVFDNLAVTQRQLNAGIARLIGALDDESILDMQSVDGELDAAIVEAVNDLRARGAARPVVVMLGQATEMARSELQSSQVRGRRRAADLSGDVDGLLDLLTGHGVQFAGVSVTAVPLPNFERLAAATGGRFERIEDPAALGDTLAGIGRELGMQYLVTVAPGDAEGPAPRVGMRRDGLSARAAPYTPRH